MAKRDKVFTVRINVRWADLDAYAHVNGTTYFTYMETARVHFYESLGFDCLHGPLRTFIARSECDYRIAIGPDDDVLVDVVVSRVGNTSFDMLYRLHDAEGLIFATGKTVMVVVDAETAQPAAVPESFHEIVDPSVDFS